MTSTLRQKRLLVPTTPPSSNTFFSPESVKHISDVRARFRHIVANYQSDYGENVVEYSVMKIVLKRLEDLGFA